MVVRVLHMFTCRRNDYAPSAVPKSNSRFRLMLRTCPAFESVPCDGGGSVRCKTDRMAQTLSSFQMNACLFCREDRMRLDQQRNVLAARKLAQQRVF